MIRFGCDESHMKMVVMKNDVPIRIDIHLRKIELKELPLMVFQ